MFFTGNIKGIGNLICQMFCVSCVSYVIAKPAFSVYYAALNKICGLTKLYTLQERISGTLWRRGRFTKQEFSNKTEDCPIIAAPIGHA